MKQIFIINGSGGSGKDTFVQLIISIKQYKVINYSSVHRIKYVARQLGWDGAKKEKDRKFLSDLKALCVQYNDYPMDCMRNKVKHFLNSDFEYLFLHIREPEEIEKARKEFGAKTIIVKRDSIKPIKSNTADANVNNYNYDVVINNNEDIESLRIKANRFISDAESGDLKDCY